MFTSKNWSCIKSSIAVKIELSKLHSKTTLIKKQYFYIRLLRIELIIFQ